MKKALKIIDQLEKTNSQKGSNILIVREKDKIIYEEKENSFLLLLIYIFIIILPWFVILDSLSKPTFLSLSILIVSDIIMILSYFRGPFKTDNRITIDLTEKEIKISKLNLLGKWFVKDRFIKTKKSNSILKDNNAFTSFHDVRLTLKYEKGTIVLLDLNNNSDLGSIFLSLNLLVKHESKENDIT